MNNQLKRLLIFSITFICLGSLSAQTISNKVSPNWEADSDWTNGAPGYNTLQNVVLNHDSELFDELIINHEVTINSHATILTGNIISIENGGSLVIDGNLIMYLGNIIVKNGGALHVKGLLSCISEQVFEVQTGGSVIIDKIGRIEHDGHWQVLNPTQITIDGNVSIGGNFHFQGTLSGTGQIYVYGNFEMEDGSNVFGCTDNTNNGCCGEGISGSCALPDVQIETFTSVQSGFWDESTTWDKGTVPNDHNNIVVNTNHTVTLKQVKDPHVINFTVLGGGIFIQDNQKLVVEGTYHIDGEHEIGNKELQIRDENITISGTGTIKLDGGNSKIKIEKNATVLEGSNLLIFSEGNSKGIELTETLVNKGIVQIATPLKSEKSGNGKWINDDGSELFIFHPDFDVELVANTAFNIVHYSDVGNQEIIRPLDDTYWCLIAGGGGTKTLSNDIIIINFLAINSTLDTDNKDITISGDWLNKGEYIGHENKVTLTGDNDLEILNSQGLQHFYNLTIDIADGDVLLFNNVKVENILEFKDGNIISSGNTLTLGNSNFESEFIHNDSSFISGKFSRWINSLDAANGALFPVGSSAKSYFIEFISDDMTEGLLSIDFSAESPGNKGKPWTDDGGTTFYNTFTDGYYKLSGSGGFNVVNYEIKVDLKNFKGFQIDGIEPLLFRSNNQEDWKFYGEHGEHEFYNNQEIDNNQAYVSRYSLDSLGHFALVDQVDCTVPDKPFFKNPDLNVCINEEGVIYTIENGSDLLTYEWNVQFGDIVDGQGNDSIVVDWGWDGAMRLIEVIAVDPNCGESNIASIFVAIEPFTTSPISGRSIVAEETEGLTYSVELNNNYNYLWEVNGGVQIAGGTTNQITIDWGTLGSANIIVKAQVGDCPISNSEILDVTLFSTYTTEQSGDFSKGETWIGGVAPNPQDNVFIAQGHNVFLSSNIELNNIIIDSASILDNGIYKLQINNFYENNGLHNANQNIGEPNIIFNASSNNALFLGKGILNAKDVTINSGLWTLDEYSLLTINTEKMDVNGSVFDVQGALRIANDIRVSNSGNFKASHKDAIVQYKSDSAQNIISVQETYYNLHLLGSGDKLLMADIEIDGNFIDEQGKLNTQGNKIIFSGNELQKIESSETISFSNLEINNFSGLTPAVEIDANLFISKSLNLNNGIVKLADEKSINITELGTIENSSENSFIDGKVSKQFSDANLFKFPTGNLDKYAPIDITPSGVANYSAQYFAQQFIDTTVDETIHSVSNAEHWMIDQNEGNSDATMEFYFYNSEFSGITDINDLTIAAYSGTIPSGSWGMVDTNPDKTYNSVKITTPIYGPMTFASINGHNPLPIELVYFNADYLGYNYVRLQWQTATEKNNAFFTIQKATEKDGIWTDIAIIEGAGNSNIPIDYRSIDTEAFTGVSYYRLKQTDYDGSYAYSQIESVNIKDMEAAPLYIFPNPAYENIQIIASGLDYKNFKYYNSFGQDVTYLVKENIANLSFDISRLAPGVYYIKTNSETLSFLKM